MGGLDRKIQNPSELSRGKNKPRGPGMRQPKGRSCGQGSVSSSGGWGGMLTAGRVMKELEGHSKGCRLWQPLEGFKQGMT